MRLHDVGIMEAARFGNKERMEILKDIGNFRIGCEYEFNTNEGIPFLDKQLELTNPMDSPLIKSLSPFLSKLSKAVARLEVLGGIESLRGYSKDMQDFLGGSITSDEISYFEDVVISEVAEISFVFVHGVKTPSDAIVSKYKGKSLDGMGILDPQTIRSSEISDIMTIASLRGRDGIRITPTIARQIKSACDSIRRYMVVDGELKNAAMTADRHYNGMLSVLHADMVEHQAATPSKIELVRKELPVDRQMIQAIMPDATVPNGVEVITKPLTFRDTVTTMNRVFEYIQKVGSTDNTTGLHINISVSGRFDLTAVNFVKMMTLLDVEFFQGLTKGSANYLKYPVRSEWVEPVFAFLKKNGGDAIKFLARVYAYNGEASFLREFEHAVTSDNTKKRAVNLKHLLNADVSQRRVEFRFFGGTNRTGYEFRAEEIQHDILQLCYLISAAADEEFLRREYLQSVMRILDRATQTTMIDGMGFSSFSTLVNFYRKTK